jgi:hypothetical protein
MPMTPHQARRLLSRGGGSTNLDGVLEVAEALLVLWGCPEHEIPGQLNQIRNEFLGRGGSHDGLT